MLDMYRAELERLGYSIVETSEFEVVGVRNKWHWDLMATNVTNVVFVRATGHLTYADIISERQRMIARSKTVDPFPLPVGLQHSRSTIAVYVADSVADPAQVLCNSLQGSLRDMLMPGRYFPAALDRSTGRSYYLRSTPALGALMYAKVRYPVQRLIDPDRAPGRERVSVFGSILGLAIAAAALMLIGTSVLLVSAFGS